MTGLLLLLGTTLQAQIAMPDTVCVGTTKTYQVNSPGVPSTYSWKLNGIDQPSTGNSITITWTASGIYQLTVQEHAANGCDGDIRAGTVVVNPVPVANAGPDLIACFNTPVTLQGSGGTAFQWTPPTYLSDPGIARPVATLPRSGTYVYSLQVSNGLCRSANSDTVFVTILPEARVFAGRDTAIALGQTLQLNAQDLSGSGFNRYAWSPSQGLSNPFVANPVASFSSIPGPDGVKYTVLARDANGCSAQDDIIVKVFTRADIYVPTAFTPNGDGKNDLALAFPVGIREFRYFSIFNRWGELVFTTRDALRGWNGIWKGIAQSSYSYVWQAEGVDYLGNVIYRKGVVTLIR